MYGIPGYQSKFPNGVYQREHQRKQGISLGTWLKIGIGSALGVMFVIAVLLGVQAVFIDTMQQAFHR